MYEYDYVASIDTGASMTFERGKVYADSEDHAALQLSTMLRNVSSLTIVKAN